MTFGIEFVSPPDSLGRRVFFLYWMQDGRRRGQIFRANTRDFARRERKRGNRIVPLKRWKP